MFSKPNSSGLNLWKQMYTLKLFSEFLRKKIYLSHQTLETPMFQHAFSFKQIFSVFDYFLRLSNILP